MVSRGARKSAEKKRPTIHKKTTSSSSPSKRVASASSSTRSSKADPAASRAAGKPKARPKAPAAKASAAKTPASKASRPPVRGVLDSVNERVNLLLQEKSEMQEIARRLRAERDSALAEATRLKDQMKTVESERSRQSMKEPQPAGPGGFDPKLDLEDEDVAMDDDFDGAASFFDRIDELRARRIELDRERSDRELEQSEQSFWLICPKCGEQMEEQEAENVKLERCDNCGGLYMDRGEVDLILTITTDRDGARRLHNILKF